MRVYHHHHLVTSLLHTNSYNVHMYVHFHLNISDKDKESDVDPLSWPFTAKLKETGRLAISLPTNVSSAGNSLGHKSSLSREEPILSGE